MFANATCSTGDACASRDDTIREVNRRSPPASYRTSSPASAVLPSHETSSTATEPLANPATSKRPSSDVAAHVIHDHAADAGAAGAAASDASSPPVVLSKAADGGNVNDDKRRRRWTSGTSVLLSASPTAIFVVEYAQIHTWPHIKSTITRRSGALPADGSHAHHSGSGRRC